MTGIDFSLRIVLSFWIRIRFRNVDLAGEEVGEKDNDVEKEEEEQDEE